MNTTLSLGGRSSSFRGQKLACKGPRASRPKNAGIIEAKGNFFRQFPPSPVVSEVVTDPSYKEHSREFRRTHFSYPDWIRHRSTARYIRHFTTLVESGIFRGILPAIAFFCSVALAAATYQWAHGAGHLASWLPAITMGHEMFVLTGPAISLMLVFRTNVSYKRWMDSRIAWGSLLNRCRDLTRQGLANFKSTTLKDALVRWVIAWGWALKNHLRPGEKDDLAARVGHVLTAEETKALCAAPHRPLFCLQMISRVVRMAHLLAPVQVAMDKNITRFQDILGECERVLRTPIPLSYSRHSSRIMMFWLMLLPFGIVKSLGFMAIGATALVSFVFLGIDEIGVTIEEPFSILPLEAIIHTVETNVMDLKANFRDEARPGFEWEAAAQSEIAAHYLLPAAARRGVAVEVAIGGSAARAAVSDSSSDGDTESDAEWLPTVSGNGIHANGNGNGSGGVRHRAAAAAGVGAAMFGAGAAEGADLLVPGPGPWGARSASEMNGSGSGISGA